MKRASSALLGLLFLAAASTSASAAITSSGNFLVGGTGSPPTLTITTPFTMVATATTNVNFLILDNWVASYDGNMSVLGATPGSLLSYQINGGPTLSVSLTQLWDHFSPPSGDVDTRDGALVFAPIALTIGQTITILSQTLVFERGPLGTTSNFNPPPASFEGEAFLTSNTGALTAYTTHVSVVPEPSAALLGAIGALGFLRRKR